MKRSEKLLEEKQVKPTAMRLLVVEEFMKTAEAMSLQALEDALPRADKVTIYRTIKTFISKGIIHTVVLPDGQTKYALCRHAGQQHSVHPHFTCERCGQTHCLPQTSMHLEDFPKGYKVFDTVLTFSGLCPKCQS